EPASVAKAPDVTQPAPPQPQQQEMPATVESNPSAPPVPSAAEPVKEPVAAETVHPAKQEPAPPAAEPAKTASERPPEAAPVPPAKPPEAEQKALEQQPQATPKPKMAKTPAPGSYCVNVGSFKLKDSTERVCGDLKKQGYEPTVETVTLKDGNTWYRVTVGSFATREEAGKFGRELESKTKITYSIPHAAIFMYIESGTSAPRSLVTGTVSARPLVHRAGHR
ncbi:MAG: SPOR domain-containing protein, partial [Proteobacteria bacterium]|nr:SPOR domain-containing protein [Pseudomonadota bacterium]